MKIYEQGKKYYDGAQIREQSGKAVSYTHLDVYKRQVMESSIKFATVINEQMISTGKSGIKGIYLVWNMVDGREKTELYKACLLYTSRCV